MARLCRITTVYGGGDFRLVFPPRKTGASITAFPSKKTAITYSNFRIVRYGGLWQEIRDQERPLPLKRDDLGTLPNSGSIGGITMGTVAYMSPEQARAKELDARTDLFSFGSVLYEMATGQLPFRGNSSPTIFEAILNRTPVAPTRLNPDLPPKLEEIINKCLEKDRNLRYQHASEIRTDLKRLKRDTDSSGARATTSAMVTHKRHAWLPWTLVALLAAGLFAWIVASPIAPGRQPRIRFPMPSSHGSPTSKEPKATLQSPRTGNSPRSFPTGAAHSTSG
jgi:serine/threonine protein kinase